MFNRKLIGFYLFSSRFDLKRCSLRINWFELKKTFKICTLLPLSFFFHLRSRSEFDWWNSYFLSFRKFGLISKYFDLINRKEKIKSRSLVYSWQIMISSLFISFIRFKKWIFDLSKTRWHLRKVFNDVHALQNWSKADSKIEKYFCPLAFALPSFQKFLGFWLDFHNKFWTCVIKRF